MASFNGESPEDQEETEESNFIASDAFGTNWNTDTGMSGLVSLLLVLLVISPMLRRDSLSNGGPATVQAPTDLPEHSRAIREVFPSAPISDEIDDYVETFSAIFEDEVVSEHKQVLDAFEAWTQYADVTDLSKLRVRDVRGFWAWYHLHSDELPIAPARSFSICGQFLSFAEDQFNVRSGLSAGLNGLAPQSRRIGHGSVRAPDRGGIAQELNPYEEIQGILECITWDEETVCVSLTSGTLVFQTTSREATICVRDLPGNEGHQVTILGLPDSERPIVVQ